jgi:hypothetical protein
MPLNVSGCTAVILPSLTLVFLIVDRRPVLKKRHLERAPELWKRRGIGKTKDCKRKFEGG